MGDPHDLLGRSAEIAAVEETLDAARKGHGNLTLISGPAGIGKSALLAGAEQLAAESGFAVLRAVGSEAERALPFGVVRQLYARLWTDRSSKTDSAHLGVLLAPGLAGAAVAIPTYQVLDALYWLVSDLATEEPLVVAIDDLQWVDGPSLAHLTFLARRLEGLPVAVICAERAHEGSGPGFEELRERVDHSLPLGPLDAATVSQLVEERLGQAPSRGFVSACLRQTGGNPLYLLEVLRETSDASRAPDDHAAAKVGEVDAERLTRHVWRRLDGIGPDAGTVAALVSLLGERAGVARISELAEISAERVEEVIEDLVAREILELREPLRFSHPIVRAAVDRGPSARQLDSWHRRAAVMLEREGADLREIGSHLIACRPRGDKWVVEQLCDFAAMAMQSGAPQQAVEGLTRALDEPAGDMRIKVLRELALAEDAADRTGPALDHLRQARGEAREGREVAEIAIAEAQVLGRLYRHGEAAAVLDKGLEALNGSDEELVERIDAELINSALMSPEARERGLARLGRYDDLTPEGPAAQAVLTARAVIAALTVQPAEQTAELAEAALRAGGLSRGGLGTAIWTLAAWALIYMNRPELARELTEAELPAVRRDGHPREISTIEVTIAAAALQEGDLRVAVSRTDAALRLFDLFSGSWGYATNAIALMETGDLAAAERTLAAAPRDLWDETVSGSFPMTHARARLRIAERRLDDAEVDIDAMRRRSEGYPPGLRGLEDVWRLLAAEVAIYRGERERALELTGVELEYAQRIGSRVFMGRALRVDGLAKAHEGIGVLRESVAVLASSPYRLEHTRSLVALGGALRREGERMAAREPLREGLDLAYRCGANGLVDEARTELRAAGARPRRALLEGPGALTPREARMAILAAQGKSNREIAQELYVTLATVEGTLWRAYGKLGISGRGAREALPEALGPLFDPSAARSGSAPRAN